MKTGGGKPQYIVIDGPEKELLEVLSFPIHGLPAVGDSDRNLPQTSKLHYYEESKLFLH